MPRLLRAALVFVLLGVVAPVAGCGGSLSEPGSAPPQGRMIVAEDGGEEEVLSDDGEAFGDELEDELPEPGAGGFFVSVSYVLMSLGAAALPFLLLI